MPWSFSSKFSVKRIRWIKRAEKETSNWFLSEAEGVIVVLLSAEGHATRRADPVTLRQRAFTAAWQLLDTRRVPQQGSFNMMATGVSVRQPLARRILANRSFQVRLSAGCRDLSAI